MLKQKTDGISTLWKPVSSHSPFYAGGKLEFNIDSTESQNIASCLYDDNIYVIDWDLGKLHHTLLEIEDESENVNEVITCFAMHPSGNEIVVSTQNNLLRHYNLHDRSCIRAIKCRMSVLSMDYDKSGTLVATGASDRTVKVWDIPHGHCTHNFGDHSDLVNVVKFHPDPLRLQLFSCSHDSTIRLYDLANSSCVAVFREHLNIPTSLAFSPDGYILATSGRDKVINIYELRENQHIKTVAVMEELESVLILSTTHSQSIFQYYSSSTSTTSIAHHGHSPLTNLTKRKRNEEEEHQHQQHQLLPVTSTIIPLPHVLVTAGEKGILHIYSYTILGKDITSFTLQLLAKLSINSASSFLSTSSISMMTTPTTTTTTTTTVNNQMNLLNAITSLNYLESRSEIVIATADHNILSYSINTEAVRSFTKENPLSHPKKAGGVVIQPSSSSPSPPPPFTLSRQLVGSYDDILDITIIPSRPPPTSHHNKSTDIDDGNNNNEFKEDDEINFHQVAVASNSCQIRILNPSFQCESLDGHSDMVLALDVSPDGLWLVSASKDKTCRVWYLPDNRCYAIATGHSDAVGAVTISQSFASYTSRNVILMSGSGDKTLRRWVIPLPTPTGTAGDNSHYHMSDREQSRTLIASHSIRAHDKDVNTVAFSPNDALLASGSQDKSIRLWRSTDLTAIATLNGHKRGIWRIVFSPVDKCLASCSGDRTVRLWSVVDYSCLRTFQGHTSSVLSVRFVNCGQQLVSGSSDGLIRLWTIRTGECEGTFDAHTDKVWTISVSLSTGRFLSGGSDGKLIVWKDATEEEEQARIELAEATLLNEQNMQNDIRHQRYGKALRTALSLKHPNKALFIITSILDNLFQNNTNNTRHQDPSLPSPPTTKNPYQSIELDACIGELTDEDISNLINYIKDWNTNAKHTYICQILIHCFFRVIKVSRLLTIHSVVEALPALLSYSDRHYSRLDRLHEACFLIEYLQSQMSLLPEENVNQYDINKSTVQKKEHPKIVKKLIK